MRDFYPPQRNRWLVRAIQLIAPWAAEIAYRLAIEVDTDSLKYLSELRHQRLLLLPNHPTFQDPIVMFLLAGRLGQAYYYLAAAEQFQGWLSHFFPSIGGYSIRRGSADRASIAQTLDLLSQPECHLVIFPEGGCSFQNDTVMPFRSGAVQLAFQAMNRQVRQGQPVPDLYVLPVAIKYRYTQDMSWAISQTLSGLEQALAVPNAGSDYARLRAIAAQVLQRVEQEYGIHQPPPDQPSWNDRILSLKAHVITTCERQLGLTPAPTDLDRERVYRIQNALQAEADSLQADVRLDRPPSTLAAMQKSIFRLLNFDAIYDGYVAANPTPERFLDTLIRLEREVFGINQPAPKGRRQAQVRVSAPINLKDYFAAYQQHRSETIEQLSRQIQQTVQASLDQLNLT